MGVIYAQALLFVVVYTTVGMFFWYWGTHHMPNDDVTDDEILAEAMLWPCVCMVIVSSVLVSCLAALLTYFGVSKWTQQK